LPTCRMDSSALQLFADDYCALSRVYGTLRARTTTPIVR
jgi:hypothetical protein